LDIWITLLDRQYYYFSTMDSGWFPPIHTITTTKKLLWYFLLSTSPTFLAKRSLYKTFKCGAHNRI
jgi:hypothetical protein